MRTREDLVWKLSQSSFRNGSGGREARDLSSAEFLGKNRARSRNMSVRSDLLFAAQEQIPNPFLLCSVTSARARQLMLAGDGRTALPELVDFALNEVAAGARGFERGGARRLSAAVPAEAT